MSTEDERQFRRERDATEAWHRHYPQGEDVISQACPDCMAGDHLHCDGKIWDEAEDRYVRCPCAEARHMKGKG